VALGDPQTAAEYMEAGDLADLIHQWAALPPKERQQKAFAALYELATTILHETKRALLG